MSAAFRDGLRKALIGLVHMWYFDHRHNDPANKGGDPNYMQVLIYPGDLGIETLDTIGRRPSRIVVTIEIEHYTP